MQCCYCYAEAETVLQCGACRCRAYCSKECQKSDWKQHKIWCGCGVAQLGVDYEVREATGKGLGMFAKKAFQLGEKILVERAIITAVQNTTRTTQEVHGQIDAQFAALSTREQAAVMSLAAVPGFQESNAAGTTSVFKGHSKVSHPNGAFSCNCFALEGSYAGQRGLCVTTSRFNHSCLPNCSRYFVEDHKLMVIAAMQPIAVDEEMTISYTTSKIEDGLEAFQEFVRSTWGFVCSCPACQDPKIFSKLTQMHRMDAAMFEMGSSGRELEAYAVGEQLLRLYDELSIGCAWQGRTYYDMFQMSVSRRATLPQAAECARQALLMWQLRIGGSKKTPAKILNATRNVESPESHQLYLCRD